MGAFDDRTMFISGASRGIGLAIAKRVAREGANVAFIAKTEDPHPKLPGTVYTAAREIEEAGGHPLPIVGDIRDEEVVVAAVEKTVETFGGIDMCVNNASAINLGNVQSLPVKRYDLMQDVNTRGTFVVSKACIPFLRQGANPHILSLSPPLNLSSVWFENHAAYTIAKYGMSMVTLGLAGELAGDGIAANCLWPRTIIATAAVQNLLGGDAAMARARKPEIVADAAHHILSRDSRSCTGNFFIDEEVLAEAGITDLSPYAYGDDSDLQRDIFLDE